MSSSRTPRRRVALALASLLAGSGLAAVPVLGAAGGAAPAAASDHLEAFRAVPYRAYVPVTYPKVVSSLFQEDLRIRGMEITQAVQCFDATEGITGCADNELRLVTGKASAARVYLASRFARRDHVPVRFYYRLQGQPTYQSVLLSGPATQTLNQASALDSLNVFFTQVGSAAVGEFYAVVDPDNAIAEQNETNNRFPASGAETVSFVPTRTLPTVGRRLDYHPSGYTGTRLASGWAVDGGGARWWNRVMPVREDGIPYRVASGYLDWTTSLGSSAGAHALIGRLNADWLYGQVPFFFGPSELTGARHVYGWAPNEGYSGGHADMPVYPHQNGFGVVGIGTDRPGTSTDDPGGGALILGHELVHDYDVLHTNTADACGSEDGNADFPYASSSIQEYGFNPATGTVYRPDETHDVMSYCPAAGSTKGWVSPFTWDRMLDQLRLSGAASASAAGGDHAGDHGGAAADGHADDRLGAAEHGVVSGDTRTGEPSPDLTIEPRPGDDDLVEANWLVVDATVASAGKGSSLGTMYGVPDAPRIGVQEQGRYAVRLLDDENQVLEDFPFDVDFTSEYAGHHDGAEAPGDPYREPNATANKLLTVPMLGARWVLLMEGDQVLDRRQVSSDAPVVSGVEPDATRWGPGTTHRVSWTGADADGDDLTYTLLGSADDGLSWSPLAGPTRETSAEVATDGLAGGNVLFRVIASDGVRVDDAVTTVPVTVPDKLPAATITQPAPGRTVPVGGLLVLEGGGTDLEDGPLPEADLRWSVDGTEVGTGALVTLDDLGPGRHTVTLTATDSRGQAATDTTEVLVTAVTAAEPAAVLEGDVVRATARFTPVDAAAGPLRCTVQYGDGSLTVPGVVDGETCTGPAHRYADDGDYRVVTTVVAGEQEIGTAAVTQSVRNVAPTAGTPEPAAPVATAGAPLSLSLPFTDPGTGDTHAATVEWGDGTVEALGVERAAAGGGTATGSHTYPSAGTYLVRVTIADDDGGVATRTVEVASVDRGPSRVTGGAALPTADGSPSRLVGEVRYRLGASLPSGFTQYDAGGHALRSTGFDWLVVSGSRATWAGTGTWDGRPGHRFLVALDDLGAGDDVVRVRVTAPDGTVVADTQPGTPHSSAPTTRTAGGNLTTHRL